MTSSRTPPPPPPSARQPPLEAGDFPRHPRPAGRRILLLSLLVSAVVHVVAIVLYPVLTDPDAFDPVLPSPPAAAPPDESERRLTLLELIEIEETQEEAEAEEEPEPETEVLEAPAETALPPAPALPAEETEDERLTAAERLQPRMGDPRLWREVEAELTDEDRARIRVYGLLRAWSDSVAAMEEEERRALDWTYTDDEGRRWGISPGRIHLGEFSLPMPIHFTTPPGLRDAVERRDWEWAEIERGAASAAVREALQERAREIRARRNAERADTLSRPPR